MGPNITPSFLVVFWCMGSILLHHFVESGLERSTFNDNRLKDEQSCFKAGNYGQICDTQFYMCVMEGENVYHKYWQSCPNPTVFDPSLSACNWPEAIHCPVLTTTRSSRPRPPTTGPSLSPILIRPRPFGSQEFNHSDFPNKIKRTKIPFPFPGFRSTRQPYSLSTTRTTTTTTTVLPGDANQTDYPTGYSSIEDSTGTEKSDSDSSTPNYNMSLSSDFPYSNNSCDCDCGCNTNTPPEPESTTTSENDTTTGITNSTDSDAPSTTIPTPISTESMTTINPTTTTTTPSEPPFTTEASDLEPCINKCQAWSLGVYWNICAGTTQTQKCPEERSTGYMSWTCLMHGKFETTHPKTRDCRTKWIKDLDNMLALNRTISREAATVILSTIQERVEDVNNSSNIYFGHEIKNILGYGPQILAKVESPTLDLHEILIDPVVKIYETLLINRPIWDELNETEVAETGTYFLERLERSLFTLSSTYRNERQDQYQSCVDSAYCKDFHLSPFSTSVNVRKLGTNTDHTEQQIEISDLTFPAEYNYKTDSFIKLPSNWEIYFKNKNETYAEYTGLSLDSNITNYLFPSSKTMINLNTNEVGSTDNAVAIASIVNGPLMSLSFGKGSMPVETQFNGEGVQITFVHEVDAWGSERYVVPRKLGPNEHPKAVKGAASCMYWNTQLKIWDSNGCHLVEAGRFKTVCECYHLTSFAVLMDLHNYTGKDLGLQILTWILCPLSLICLGLAVLTFCRVKTVKNHRVKITKHLCTCLFFATIGVLLLMDRNVFAVSDTLCQIFGAFTHYLYLCSFMWMLLEGLLLYRMVVVVFETRKNYEVHQLVLAYFVPLIIVGVTFTVGIVQGEPAYGGDAYCWLEDNYKWSFLGPVMFVVVFNMAILSKSLHIAYSIQNLSTRGRLSKTTEKKLHRFKHSIYGAYSTSILLGWSWIFGYFMLIPNGTIAIISAYIFTIFNASQGIFLFSFHCIGNNHIRHVYTSKLSIIYRSSKTKSSSLQDLITPKSQYEHGTGSTGKHTAYVIHSTYSPYTQIPKRHQ